MSFQFSEPQKASIKVIGVGGAGCNAVNTMIASRLENVDFIVSNTDRQALERNRSPIKVQLGEKVTKGLGAGANPEIGRTAALEDIDRIKDAIEGSDMVFVAAGMGGGTGTGAAPVIAQAARSLGILTVGVVTKPFRFEGKVRGRLAEEGLKTLEEQVDSLIVIPNEKLFSLADRKLTLLDGFKMADEVLLHAVRSISDLINVPGLINLDFADVKTIMTDSGMAFMGLGIDSSDQRAAEAARKAIANPLLDDISIRGARGMLINITASSTMTFDDLEQATDFIREEAHEEANIIFGAAIDDTMAEKFQITVIATGFAKKQAEQAVPERVSAVQAKAVNAPEIFDDSQIIEQPQAESRTDSRVKLGIISDFDEDDDGFDIPTFMRRKQAQ
ncbi:MAG: cell division protein FtsZ [Deltaproteobacteria bacterium]|nr:cell division protein FtsZ [Deltaproteobacteria bacterium]